MFLKFPEKFLWGSATSAHQVEGGNHNDWSEWEQSPARIAQLKREGKDPRDFISGAACDSYHRYEEDFDIAQQLGHTIHRFSIEWSRIEPEEGKFDEDAMRHYVNVVKALRERGMEPMVTLWHFTNPLWFSQRGGFLHPDAPLAYKRFISYVVDNLKDRVGLWITFNEATSVYALLAYLRGIWPPQMKSIFAWRRFRKNIIAAHTLAYREIKRMYGTSHNIFPLVGAVENNAYFKVSGVLKYLGIGAILNRIYNTFLWSRTLPYQDFLGLNYYTARRIPASSRSSGIADPGLGWEYCPEGIYRRLMDLKKFGKPVFITENGWPHTGDDFQRRTIREHLAWIWRAIRDGVDVRGYCYWSLLDNFEWALGYTKRFGLAEVNYATQVRTIRPAALECATIIRENGLEGSE